MATSLNRRQFVAHQVGDLFRFGGLGLSAIGLNHLLQTETEANASDSSVTGSAKSVIFLFMAGGPSQVDLFDPKPELDRLAGRDVPDSIARTVPAIKRAGLKNLMSSPWKFSRHGNSGLDMSELIPHTHKIADELCVIRSMQHRNPVHGPGECVALTGTAQGNRPSLGAWSYYGLGRMTENLPAFVAMNLNTDGMQFPQAAGWREGFLPSEYQGTLVDVKQGINHAMMPEGIGTTQRQNQLELIRWFNQRHLDSIGKHSELEARLKSYKTAFKLQSTAPELFELTGETDETHTLYGIGQERTNEVGRACLLARRMVERGVRFVQIRVGGWDAHGNIKGNHTKMCGMTDQPVAGLVMDLRRRGLLDSTLVVWGGEFGRTPTMEGQGNGRDHSPSGYTMWLAGGGVRGGTVIGQTDALGYVVTERPVSPQDFHATILRGVGLDANKVVYEHHGRAERPTVFDGAAVDEVFA